MTEAAHFPPIHWAQRINSILITIPVVDAKNVRIELPDSGKTLVFSCEGGASERPPYACSLRLYRRVSPEESSHVVHSGGVDLTLIKASSDAAEREEDDFRSWPRLTESKAKNANIHVLWSKWKDADEEEEENISEMNAGMNYEEIAAKLMAQRSKEEVAAALGPEGQYIPAFGSAAGQAPMTEAELNAEDEYDDMPPLEETE